MRRVSLSGLVIVTLAATVTMTVVLSSRAQPRPYYTIGEIIRRHASDRSLSGAVWKVHVTPDIDGPFRLAGNDWRSHAMFQSAPGEGVRGWIDSGTGRRQYDHVGIPDVSLLVVPLENAEDQAACLVLKR